MGAVLAGHDAHAALVGYPVAVVVDGVAALRRPGWIAGSASLQSVPRAHTAPLTRAAAEPSPSASMAVERHVRAAGSQRSAVHGSESLQVLGVPPPAHWPVLRLQLAPVAQ